MNSPHFFLFSFLIFLVSMTVISDTVSAYGSPSTSPYIMIDEGPSDAFISAYNAVKGWFQDQADDVADVKDNISSLSDIPGAVWNYVVNKILNFLSYPIGLLAGRQAWHEAFWDNLASEMSPSMADQSITLISSVAICLILILVIRLYVWILSVIPMI